LTSAGSNNIQCFVIDVNSLSPSTVVHQKIKALEDAGFILRFLPHKNTKKGIYYKVIDEYALFYLQWIEPLKETLMIRGLKPHYWETIKATSSWDSWAGYAFELICYKHLTQISDALGLSPTAIPMAWRYIPKKGSKEHGAQIDVLFDRLDDAITIGEIKFTQKPFVIDKSYAAALNRKLDVYRIKTGTDKQLFIAFISANGLKPTMYSDEMVSNVVILDDLFT